MKKAITVRLLAAVLAAVFIISPCQITAGAVSVSAASAILIDSSSGEVIYEKDADTRRPMASTTKIMTGIIAIEKYDLDRAVTVSKQAVGVEGSSIYLYENEKMTMKDLLYALLLQSANDAAAAIAIEIAGSTEAFAELMNEKARELGLQNTSFANPHGLHSDDHYTTARELAALTRYAMQNAVFKEMVSTKRRVIPMRNGEASRLLINHNRLLTSYEGAIGVKTGFTKKSGRCLVSAAERGGVMLIAVTLNAPNDWSDHKNMFDYGFSLLESVTLLEEGGISGRAHIVSGKKDELAYCSFGSVSAVLPKDRGEIKTVIEMQRFYYAPIEKGQVIGRAVFLLDGREVASCEIRADESVQKIAYKKGIWGFILSFFKQKIS